MERSEFLGVTPRFSYMGRLFEMFTKFIRIWLCLMLMTRA